jgi:zinc D-Ala-D-Ala carboxypeptidase
MRLSSHFSLSEMTRSPTAEKFQIPNEPSAAEIENLRTLCSVVLDPLRESLGQAIKVNSGYRSPALNRRIGGSATSQHTQGRATDIQCPGMSTMQLFKKMVELELPFDQLIYEAASRTAQWVHVSHDPARNRSDLRIARFGADGKPQAYPSISRLDALALVDTAPMRGALEYVELGDEPE